MPGTLGDTYVAAIQHGHFDPGGATLVGVVRRPTPWFSGTVDENHQELGPPSALLERVKDRQATLEADGYTENEAHNQAWVDVSFASTYRRHLDDDPDATDAYQTLLDRIENGEGIVLVCFENTENKRCHRTILRQRLEADLHGVGGLDEETPNRS